MSHGWNVLTVLVVTYMFIHVHPINCSNFAVPSWFDFTVCILFTGRPTPFCVSYGSCLAVGCCIRICSNFSVQSVYWSTSFCWSTSSSCNRYITTCKHEQPHKALIYLIFLSCQLVVTFMSLGIKVIEIGHFGLAYMFQIQTFCRIKPPRKIFQCQIISCPIARVSLRK